MLRVCLPTYSDGGQLPALLKALQAKESTSQHLCFPGSKQESQRWVGLFQTYSDDNRSVKPERSSFWGFTWAWTLISGLIHSISRRQRNRTRCGSLHSLHSPHHEIKLNEKLMHRMFSTECYLQMQSRAKGYHVQNKALWSKCWEGSSRKGRGRGVCAHAWATRHLAEATVGASTLLKRKDKICFLYLEFNPCVLLSLFLFLACM